MIEIAIRRRLGGFDLAVELEAAEDQIVVLFGPSGAGKSMTLASVAGLLRPDSGRIVAGDGSCSILRPESISRPSSGTSVW